MLWYIGASQFQRWNSYTWNCPIHSVQTRSLPCSQVNDECSHIQCSIVCIPTLLHQGERKNLARTTVALLSPATEQGGGHNFTYQNGESSASLWPSGIPSDGTPVEVEHYPFTALMVIVYLYAAAGIGFAIICLIFTILFRKKK